MIASKLKPYKKQKLRLESKFFIGGVGEPFNIAYCTPPKSGTTSWHRGIAVLKDFIEGKQTVPEDQGSMA